MVMHKIKIIQFLSYLQLEPRYCLEYLPNNRYRTLNRYSDIASMNISYKNSIKNINVSCIKYRKVLWTHNVASLEIARNVFSAELRFFTFFCIHKKKGLNLRKFSTSGFRWIYLFWHVMNIIWPFLKNIRQSAYRSDWLYACLQNFVDTVSQELIRGNQWNFVFSCTLIYIGADQILVYIAQEVPMLFDIFDFFKTMV